jgi:hypothetical protein
MSLSELLPEVRSLSRIEKLQLIQLLADDLARSEEFAPLESGQEYPLWSPDRAYGAAAVLLQELESERKGP